MQYVGHPGLGLVHSGQWAISGSKCRHYSHTGQHTYQNSHYVYNMADQSKLMELAMSYLTHSQPDVPAKTNLLAA